MVGFKGLFTKKTLFGLFLGQILSLFITSTGFSSSELARRDHIVVLEIWLLQTSQAVPSPG
ncbi:putative solute carrier family 35 member SLC35F1/F2/F6 [Helianthus annuus]|nr:putative solute carrier family 35 member SLC35F1/F2/F6 [Helianthus annuus]